MAVTAVTVLMLVLMLLPGRATAPVRPESGVMVLTERGGPCKQASTLIRSFVG